MSVAVAPNVSSSTVPYFLKAPTAKRLWELMILNNQKLKGYVTYFDIQYIEKESRWYCWYVVDIEKVIMVGGDLNGNA